MSEMGKWLVVFGLVLVGLGLVLWLGAGRGWIGRLPGDIHIQKGNFTFYFPLTTCLLLSVVLTLIFRLFGK